MQVLHLKGFSIFSAVPITLLNGQSIKCGKNDRCCQYHSKLVLNIRWKSIENSVADTGSEPIKFNMYPDAAEVHKVDFIWRQVAGGVCWPRVFLPSEVVLVNSLKKFVEKIIIVHYNIIASVTDPDPHNFAESEVFHVDSNPTYYRGIFEISPTSKRYAYTYYVQYPYGV